MPDLMDTNNYAPSVRHQPYNGNPHLHQVNWSCYALSARAACKHPFHEHGNHVRILGRDGNLLSARPIRE